MLKEIAGFNGYFISDTGEVYSTRNGVLYQMHPFFDSRHRYKIIKLSKIIEHTQNSFTDW